MTTPVVIEPLELGTRSYTPGRGWQQPVRVIAYAGALCIIDGIRYCAPSHMPLLQPMLTHVRVRQLSHGGQTIFEGVISAIEGPTGDAPPTLLCDGVQLPLSAATITRILTRKADTDHVPRTRSR